MANALRFWRLKNYTPPPPEEPQAEPEPDISPRTAGGRFEVFPVDGEWSYQYRFAHGDTQERGQNYPTRSEAIAACKVARGDVDEELFRADGTSLGHAVSRGREAIVLLRPDGSLYGELDHEERQATGAAQRVSIKPAGEQTEVNDG